MGVTMEMFLQKTQILNKTPKPRNIMETKGPRLPTENYHDTEQLKKKNLSKTERKVLQRHGPLLLLQARCLLLCKIKHLSASTEIKYMSKIFPKRTIVQQLFSHFLQIIVVWNFNPQVKLDIPHIFVEVQQFLGRHRSPFV